MPGEMGDRKLLVASMNEEMTVRVSFSATGFPPVCHLPLHPPSQAQRPTVHEGPLPLPGASLGKHSPGPNTHAHKHLRGFKHSLELSGDSL